MTRREPPARIAWLAPGPQLGSRPPRRRRARCIIDGIGHLIQWLDPAELEDKSMNCH